MQEKKQRIVFDYGNKTYSGIVTANHGDQNAYHGGERIRPETNFYVEFVHDAQSAGPTGDPGYVKEQPDGVRNLRFEDVE